MIAEKLRKAILQAAMQGKLTEQLPEDGDAHDLLAQIQQEKQQKIKAGEIKATKPLPPIDPEEAPYEIPVNWAWARLEEISEIVMGQSPPGESVNTINGMEFHQGKIYFESLYIGKSKHKCLQPKKEAKPGSVLLCVRAPVGIVNLTNRTICIGRGLASLFPSSRISNLFLFYFLQTQISTFEAKATGSTFKAINLDIIKNSLLVLPPIEEQKRIVSIIQAIVRIIDELENVEKKLKTLEKEFPEKLKKSLLQAAMQGKLTEQLPEDGDAHDLLAEIQQEKKRKAKAGEIKATKPLPPIDPDEVPYEIPANWVWTHLSIIGNWKAGLTPRRSNTSYYSNGTVPWLVTGDLNDGLITTTRENISIKALIETRLIINNIGTVLMAMYGATIGKLGVLGIEATTNQACIACSVKDGILNWYLFYYLLYSRDKFRLLGAGGAQPNISKEKILPFFFPTPPFPEQKRIVKLLDKLIPLCETLK